MMIERAIKLFFSQQEAEVPDLIDKSDFLWTMTFNVDKHGLIQLNGLVDKLENHFGTQKLNNSELNIWQPSCSMWMNVSRFYN